MSAELAVLLPFLAHFHSPNNNSDDRWLQLSAQKETRSCRAFFWFSLLSEIYLPNNLPDQDAKLADFFLSRPRLPVRDQTKDAWSRNCSLVNYNYSEEKSGRMIAFNYEPSKPISTED